MTRLLRGAARLLQAQTACPAACGAPSTSGRALVPGTGATTIIAGSSVRQACSGWGAPLQRHFGSSSSSSSAPLWRRAALGGGGGGILAGAAAGSSGGSSCSLPAAAAAALRRAACPHSLQQARGLLGKPSLAPKKPNYQDHNTKKPKTTKIKTRGILKKRIIVAKDGVMWRTQAGRRHKRIKKSRGRLSELRGLAPLASSWARKLRKLGYKRRWWYAQKA